MATLTDQERRERNNLASKRYRLKNPQKSSEVQKRYYKNHKKKCLKYRSRYSAFYRKEHPDRIKKTMANWRRKNKDYESNPKRRFQRGKALSFKKNLEWGISYSEYVEYLKKRCFYCDDSLSPAGVALDRMDNSKGYLYSNVVPCCGPCNRTKGDRLTHEEMIVAMRAIKNFRLSKILGVKSGHFNV